MTLRSCAGIALGLALAGCVQPEEPAKEDAATPGEGARSSEAVPAPIPAAEPAGGDVYFAGFETRDYVLWLHADADPRRYTVKSKDGRVLASCIDEACLERDYPELHGLLFDAVDKLDLLDIDH